VTKAKDIEFEKPKGSPIKKFLIDVGRFFSFVFG